jgi:hypothetical protein
VPHCFLQSFLRGCLSGSFPFFWHTGAGSQLISAGGCGPGWLAPCAHQTSVCLHVRQATASDEPVLVGPAGSCGCISCYWRPGFVRLGACLGRGWCGNSHDPGTHCSSQTWQALALPSCRREWRARRGRGKGRRTRAGAGERGAFVGKSLALGQPQHHHIFAMACTVQPPARVACEGRGCASPGSGRVSRAARKCLAPVATGLSGRRPALCGPAYTACQGMGAA